MGWAGEQAMARIWLLLQVRGEPQEGPGREGSRSGVIWSDSR